MDDYGNDRGGFGRGRGGGRDRDFGPKPVKVDQELDVTIEAVAQKGDGIAKIEGFVIFVPNAKQGQTVKVKIKEVRSSFAIGEVVGGEPVA